MTFAYLKTEINFKIGELVQHKWRVHKGKVFGGFFYAGEGHTRKALIRIHHFGVILKSTLIAFNDCLNVSV